MVSKKVSELPSLTAPSGNDKIYIIDDQFGTPVSKNISVDKLFASVPSNTSIQGTLSVDDVTTINANTTINGKLKINGTVEVENLITSDTAFSNTVISGARPLINTYIYNRVLSDNDKGTVILMNSSSNTTITLNKTWEPGDGVLVRRIGTGEVFWQASANCVVYLPQSRADHIKIAEQHSEILIRVIWKSGNTAFSIEGATSS